ncbi:E3 ubiquitin-protein ligase MYLIP-A [Fasciola gigantica]|uniref:RING-type E3 ubiquitin transferase n=1 Tax=Fasciola gigantica TaxID=46835 RepID=A0A504Z9P0_FASGI|nr:E3 ubiquitin-protein ligase MYLIP-A [Fasciola gigantica]
MAHGSVLDGMSQRSGMRHLGRTTSESGRFQTAAPIICYITQADNNVFHVEVEHKADGQEVIDKICKMLGIMDEAEYFGVQFMGLKNEMLWLNNRNRLSKQVPGSSPYHLYFRVKYYVPPHAILLEDTRNQFYNNVVQQLKGGVWDAESTLETQANLIALMAYTQFGPYNANTTPCKYACFWPDCRGEIPPEAIRMAANFHRDLDGFTVSHAKYELLRIVSMEFPSYGTHFYEVKDIFDRKLLLGVGPEGLALCSSHSSVIERFPYCRVHTVTTSARVVTLNLLEDDGSVKGRNYQLATNRLASSLYRSITEIHAFFRCDSVRDTVLWQTTRDLKDALVSIFDHNGKDYAFDVRYTFREVYDRARRHLYHCTSNTSPRGSPPNHAGIVLNNDESIASSSGGDALQRSSGDNASTAGGLKREYSSRAESIVSTEEVQEIVQERLREVGICRLCMDAPISRVFFPCGHIICCATCADRVEECSICRKPIELRHPCFLPWSADEDLENIMHSSTRRSRRLSAKSEIDPSVSSSSSVFMPHTASAPTCNLFCPPSTNCLTLTITDPVTERLSPDVTTAQTNVNSSVESTNPFSRSSSEGSASHTPTVNSTPVHTCASSQTPVLDPDNHSAISLTSDINIRSETALSSPEPHANGPRRPPVHVTWQNPT